VLLDQPLPGPGQAQAGTLLHGSARVALKGWIA
jgi:hypothetical protein